MPKKLDIYHKKKLSIYLGIKFSTSRTCVFYLEVNKYTKFPKNLVTYHKKRWSISLGIKASAQQSLRFLSLRQKCNTMFFNYGIISHKKLRVSFLMHPRNKNARFGVHSHLVCFVYAINYFNTRTFEITKIQYMNIHTYVHIYV